MNSIVKLLTGKEIVLYLPHRQLEPIVRYAENRTNYLFVKWGLPFRIAYWKGKGRLGRRLVYLLVTLLNPRYILSANWVTRRDQILHIWCKNNRPSEFIAVQHGAYIGGSVKRDHRYMHCDKFLVWGRYFKNMFDKYNPTKTDKIILFGNPVYNKYNRLNFEYPTEIKQVLIAFRNIDREELRALACFERMPYKCYIKARNNKQLPKALPFDIVSGRFYDIVQEYDLVIADHSTTLLDAIFFKRMVLFVNIGNKANGYSKYMNNADGSGCIHHIDIKAQERLLSSMVTAGTNDLAMALY